MLQKAKQAALVIAVLAFLVALVSGVAGSSEVAKFAVVVGVILLAVGFSAIGALAPLNFTAWIIAAVVSAVFAPGLFEPFAPDDPRYRLVLVTLIQAVMFGMGTQMGVRDFWGVVKSPLPVAIGLICQFTIMPLVGYGLAIAFQLPGEIAAGMVLIGACSSGLASNVMAYIGKANLALSITLTAVATLLAPVVTPFWMTTLASGFLEGTQLELSFVAMMVLIIKIVIVPTGAALVHDYLLNCGPSAKRVVYAVAGLGMVFVGMYAVGILRSNNASVAAWSDVLAWVLGGMAFGVFYHLIVNRAPQLQAAMPAVAMAGIIYVTGMTTAKGRESLMAVGFVLIIAAALHNLLGYLLGYWMSRGLGLDKQSARTVAFEVGMQNGGMATGLAGGMGRLGTLGLPAAIFIAWMNISGSLLANLWRRQPVESSPKESSPVESSPE